MNRNQMRRLANRSTHKLYCHSALIYSGSRLLAVGYNHEYMHAEVHAIKRLRALYREDIGNSRRPTNLHIISFMQKRRSWNVGNSLPCPNCMRAIRLAGIRKITFFNGPETCQMSLS